MTITPEQAKALREPFPPMMVGKLPKPYKRESPKGNCPECHTYHGLPAVHLDYVGHAAVTDRLLQVDPAWSWEPFAVDGTGLPALDGRGNLWIRLTVCGVTRIGVGDGASLKEIIGDAIRNGAMRFGVALDLWAKEDLHAPEAGALPAEATPAPSVSADTFRAEGAPEPITEGQRRAIFAAFPAAGIDSDARSAEGRATRLAYLARAVGRNVEIGRAHV